METRRRKGLTAGIGIVLALGCGIGAPQKNEERAGQEVAPAVTYVGLCKQAGLLVLEQIGDVYSRDACEIAETIGYALSAGSEQSVQILPGKIRAGIGLGGRAGHMCFDNAIVKLAGANIPFAASVERNVQGIDEVTVVAPFTLPFSSGGLFSQFAAELQLTGQSYTVVAPGEATPSAVRSGDAACPNQAVR
jgi:hypothetical protein